MLSTNSAPWPIASSHQHQERRTHTTRYIQYKPLLLCTLHSACGSPLARYSNSLSLVTSSHFLLIRPGSRVNQAGQATRAALTLPCPILSCPVPRVPDRDTALTATASYPTR